MRPYALAALAIIVIGLADTAFTLHLVSRGADESNPLMAWALQRGVGTFVGLKMGLHVVSAALLFLVPHRVPRGDLYVAAGFGAYIFAFAQHCLGMSMMG